MSWWGKVVGGTFGFMLGGPLGAAFGAAVGHQFDAGMRDVGARMGNDQERIQASFFTAVFSVMGHIAKADGQVTHDEIEMARKVMSEMALDETQARVAMKLFNHGKPSAI